MRHKKMTLAGILALQLACFLPLMGQSTSHNYIRIRTSLTGVSSASSLSSSNSLRTVQYFDNLGRLEETVLQGRSPSSADLVSYTEYDDMDRPTNQWTLFPKSGNNGAYVSLSTLRNASTSYFNDDAPYEQTNYKRSLLSYPDQRYALGWEFTDNPKGWSYYVNSTSDAKLKCTRYVVSSSGTLSADGTYPAGTFRVTSETDEDGHTVYTFKDVKDRLILLRRVSGSEYSDTYYVYDPMDRLAFVLQPMYQRTADADKYAFRYKYDDKYAFRYKYDSRGRIVEKKVPGADAVTYVYDNDDRLTFSQDGVQRASNKWTYYLYDDLDRLTEQGECTNKNVSSGKTVLLQHYYDDYSFRSQSGFNNSNFPAGTVNAKGLLTATVTSVLGSTDKQYAAYYYDYRGRVVKEVRSNLLGGYDVTGTSYTFTSHPSTVTRTHTASGKTGRTEVYTYTYDNADRLTKVTHKLGSTQVTLAGYTYDDLERLQTKSLHGSTSNKVTYAYNIRDWLTGISGSQFTQSLYYTDGSGTFCYNGNISSVTWKAGNESTTRGYKFSYDNLNRLTASVSSNANRFTEKVTGYDLNGNITGLQRYGQTGASTYGLIDNLTYTLSGNQVTRVDDAVSSSAYNNGFEFKDAVKQTNEYAYDKNGNLTKDLNRNITSIQYNCLNLPSKVTFKDGSTIAYLYAADGTKLRTVHKIGSTTTTTDYCGNVVYENGSQKYLLTEEGYVTLADSKYHYYLKDYQGNNRVVISSTGTVEETNHYYPFGGVFAATNNVQPYKYNGKEFDSKNGLNWYDYGARHYDAALGRFVTVDPLAEQDYAVSPYTYCGNNPVLRIDKDGKIWETVWDVGNMLYDAGAAIAAHLRGDHVSAQSHWVDLGVDAIAAALPFVPAGTTKALKAADKGVDAVKTAKQVDKASEITTKGKYANLLDSKTVSEGKSFTRTQKQKILEENKNRNGGILKSDLSGKELDMPVQSRKGERANMNQAEIDHITPKSKGGSNSYSNAQVLSKEENLRKGNRIEK